MSDWRDIKYDHTPKVDPLAEYEDAKWPLVGLLVFGGLAASVIGIVASLL
jgi:hypothetical protein